MFEIVQGIPVPALSCFTHKPENAELQLSFVIEVVEGNGEGEIKTNRGALQARKFHALSP